MAELNEQPKVGNLWSMLQFCSLLLAFGAIASFIYLASPHHGRFSDDVVNARQSPIVSAAIASMTLVVWRAVPHEKRFPLCLGVAGLFGALSVIAIAIDRFLG